MPVQKSTFCSFSKKIKFYFLSNVCYSTRTNCIFLIGFLTLQRFIYTLLHRDHPNAILCLLCLIPKCIFCFHILAQSIQNYTDDEVRVVLEATGIYHFPVVSFLQQHDFFVCVVNPLLMKKYGDIKLRQGKPIRWTVFGLQTTVSATGIISQTFCPKTNPMHSSVCWECNICITQVSRLRQRLI